MSSDPINLWQRSWDPIFRMSQAADLEDLGRSLKDLADALGCHKYFVAIGSGSAVEYMGSPVLTNWPMQTRESYTNAKLGLLDPAVVHTRQAFTPLVWQLPEWHGHIDPLHYDFVEKDGSVAGLVVPMKGPPGQINLFSLVSSDNRDIGNQHATIAAAASEVAQMRILALGAASWSSSEDWKRINGLSGTQKQVAKWVSHGKTNPEIATILGLKRRTVDYHVAEILTKLDVTSRTQVAALYALYDN